MKKEEITSALFDAYDIKNVLSNQIKRKPKDNDGTETTIGDCLDHIIFILETLEHELFLSIGGKS